MQCTIDFIAFQRCIFIHIVKLPGATYARCGLPLGGDNCGLQVPQILGGAVYS